MGVNRPRSKFCRMIKEKLGLKEKTLTAHFGRCSGAVTLVDDGILMSSLKQAGRWALLLAVQEYMDHSHASKNKRMTLLHTEESNNPASEKKAKNIETSRAMKRKAVDNNTECSDSSNDSSNNNNNSDNNDYSKTDQMGAIATANFPASMQDDNKKQKQ
eukprot:15325958-Ditylum_brightwellii.AAC.1